MKYIKRKRQPKKMFINSIKYYPIDWIPSKIGIAFGGKKKDTVQRVDIVNGKITGSQMIERRREFGKKRKRKKKKSRRCRKVVEYFICRHIGDLLDPRT